MVNSFECRICYEDEKQTKKLIRPCACDGSRRYVHRKCLEDWMEYTIDENNKERCQDCHQKYIYYLKYPEETYTIKILLDDGNGDIIIQYSFIFFIYISTALDCIFNG